MDLVLGGCIRGVTILRSRERLHRHQPAPRSFGGLVRDGSFQRRRNSVSAPVRPSTASAVGSGTGLGSAKKPGWIAVSIDN